MTESLSDEEIEVHPTEVWWVAIQVTGHVEETEESSAAAFLLASAIVGPDEARIAEWLDLHHDTAGRFADVARRQGIWRWDGKVAGGDWFGDEGGIALNLDVSVLLGYLSKKR